MRLTRFNDIKSQPNQYPCQSQVVQGLINPCPYTGLPIGENTKKAKTVALWASPNICLDSLPLTGVCFIKAMD